MLWRPDLILYPPDISNGVQWNTLAKISNIGKTPAKDIRGFIKYYQNGKKYSIHELINLRNIEALNPKEEKMIDFSFYENIYQYDSMEIVLIYGSYPLGIHFSSITKYHIIWEPEHSISEILFYKREKPNVHFFPDRWINKYERERDSLNEELNGRT